MTRSSSTSDDFEPIARAEAVRGACGTSVLELCRPSPDFSGITSHRRRTGQKRAACSRFRIFAEQPTGRRTL
jgi:hypothetical protein